MCRRCASSGRDRIIRLHSSSRSSLRVCPQGTSRAPTDLTDPAGPNTRSTVFEWVTHNEKRILVGRFTGLSDAVSLELIDQIEREILKHRQETPSVLFLTCGATSMNDQLIRRWREFAATTDGI